MLTSLALFVLSPYRSKGISLLARVSLPCSLCFLFFRNNGISSFQEVAKLRVLPMLQALVLLDNPCSEKTDYRLEVLALLPHLQRLDKDVVEQEERAEAKEICQRRQEEEKVRPAWPEDGSEGRERGSHMLIKPLLL